MLAEYVYLEDQLLATVKPGESTYYFHNDHLGTPQVLTDGNGNVAWKAVYLPFGGTQILVESVENPFRFPGQYYDQETGLNYNYFRYYYPPLGRYITPDPIGLRGGTNLFAYNRNNPIRYIDRYGLQSVVTDMTQRTTTFDPRPLEPNGEPITIETRVNITTNSAPGAGDPFTTPNVTVIDNINDPAYGPPGAYIDTGDPRGRDIHGGGTGLPDPYAPRQGWVQTRGCTRGQNEDVQRLGEAIRRFQERNPGVQIPYTRRQE